MKTWILNRLKERSTWSALITLAGLAGLSLKPELKEAIITAGVAVISVIFAATSDGTASAANTTISDAVEKGVTNEPDTVTASEQSVASPELTEEQRKTLSE